MPRYEHFSEAVDGRFRAWVIDRKAGKTLLLSETAERLSEQDAEIERLKTEVKALRLIALTPDDPGGVMACSPKLYQAMTQPTDVEEA
jgi:hypothetical protein